MIRKSTIQDIDSILNLLEEGRKKMTAEGNLHQWKVGYPPREQILKDVEKGVSYLMVRDGEPIATFVLAEGPDPTYLSIYEGQWLNDEPYAVIHRIASAPGVHGIMKEVLDFAFTQTGTLRIDTHKDNHTMQKLLNRYGFTYCGIIYLENGDSRLAFQKTLRNESHTH
jgi:RimJ/RimL family protein N-acetyltransferase